MTKQSKSVLDYSILQFHCSKQSHSIEIQFSRFVSRDIFSTQTQTAATEAVEYSNWQFDSRKSTTSQQLKHSDIPDCLSHWRCQFNTSKSIFMISFSLSTVESALSIASLSLLKWKDTTRHCCQTSRQQQTNLFTRPPTLFIQFTLCYNFIRVSLHLFVIYSFIDFRFYSFQIELIGLRSLNLLLYLFVFYFVAFYVLLKGNWVLESLFQFEFKLSVLFSDSKFKSIINLNSD